MPAEALQRVDGIFRHSREPCFPHERPASAAISLSRTHRQPQRDIGHPNRTYFSYEKSMICKSSFVCRSFTHLSTKALGLITYKLSKLPAKSDSGYPPFVAGTVSVEQSLFPRK